MTRAAKVRKLVQIPVIHTPQDLGSQREAVRREYIARFGREQWGRHLELIAELWNRIGRLVLALPVDFRKVRLYQDGLPECGREQEIVEELAREGSRNHKLLLELVKNGARLMGTEDLSLLMEERERLLERRSAAARPGYDALMRRRDEHIASRIDATLKQGELGLLFMGALHRVTQLLPKDIAVRTLTDQREG